MREFRVNISMIVFDAETGEMLDVKTYTCDTRQFDSMPGFKDLLTKPLEDLYPKEETPS